MNDVTDIYNEAANKWSDNKGVGSVILSEPLSVMNFVTMVLDKMVAKTPELTSLIITETMEDRANITYYLDNTSELKDIHKQLITDKKCLILTREYVERSPYKPSTNSHKDVLITINVKKFRKIAEKYNGNYFKFKLLATNSIDSVADNAVLMYKYAPKVYEINYAHLINRSIHSPIKEYQKGVVLTDADRIYYDRCSQYINESVTIFGSFDKLEECRTGNPRLNIAAETCRLQVAESNGWSAKMDMTDAMCRKIDELYNPSSLIERVNQTYNIIRERTKIVTDNIVKLDAILDIVKENIGKRILIISKNGVFASKVTEYLNANIKYEGKSIMTNGEIFQTRISILQYDYCGNYHNDMEGIQAYDKNGKPKVYKSGAKVGQPVIIKAQAQRTRNLELFNDDYMKVLSANNSIDTSFKGVVDVVIFTSPLCSSIRDLKYRIPNLSFSSVPNIIYKIYCRGTNEEKKLIETKGGKDYEIVKDSEIDFIIGE